MTINTNPLSYNGYIQQIGIMAVVNTEEVGGVYQFDDAPAQGIVGQMLNYAELRIQRDLDLLQSQTSNTYALTAGTPLLSIPVDDFFTVQTLSVQMVAGGTVYNEMPLLPTSKEFIQNCYSGMQCAGIPQYYAMYGDFFGDSADTYVNVLLGPPPNYAYQVNVTGTVRMPSLAKYATAGIADTEYTWISTYLPDMLMMASMIYISGFQRNFGVMGDDPASGMTYEKQYQALRLGAIAEENGRKLQASAWSAYSTPTAATPTRG